MNTNVKMITDFLTAKTKNASIHGDNFSISEGTMVFEDYFISLNAIATVELKEQKEQPLLMWIIEMVFGFFLLLIPLKIIQVFGMIILPMGFVTLLLTISNNNKANIYMVVSLVNGRCYTYSFEKKDKEFVRQMYEVIRTCINNRGASYNFMVDENKIVNNIDNSDRSIGKITNSTIGDGNAINIGGNTGVQAGRDVNIGSGNTEVQTAGDVIIGKGNTHNAGLTVEEWNDLETFFTNRKNAFQDNSEIRDICEQILQHIKKKDEKSLKSFIKTCSRAALKTIIGSKAAEGFSAAMNVLQKFAK